ncbi:MAG: hypothetical protein ACLFO2_02375 [Candidatus Woesearchaeota archaeon]
MDKETFEPARIQALEEVVYQTNAALETLLQLMIDKGYFTEQELMEKMDELAEHEDEDSEELQRDAEAPRDQDEEKQ